MRVIRQNVAKKRHKILEFQREFLMHDIDGIVLKAIYRSPVSVSTPSYPDGQSSNSLLSSSQPTSSNRDHSYASHAYNENIHEQRDQRTQNFDPYRQAIFMSLAGDVDTVDVIFVFFM